MKKAILFSILAAFISVSGLSTQADAKRFGGGMSFGKSFSKQKSFSRTSPTTGPKSGIAGRGARAGGMMGILGGLAVGGLLGAMFFDGGFEGINLFDILLIGGAIFLIMRLMRSSAAARQAYAHAGHAPQQPEEKFNDDNSTFSGTDATSSTAKPDIDEAQFLDTAKHIFNRMQAAWDAKDSDDIRAFTTPDIAKHVIKDIEALGDKVTKTEVVTLNANLENTWLESDLEWVAVHFQAMLKEETLDAAGKTLETESSEVNEIWIFQHQANSDDPTWYLAGIQQA